MRVFLTFLGFLVVVVGIIIIGYLITNRGPQEYNVNINTRTVQPRPIEIPTVHVTSPTNQNVPPPELPPPASPPENATNNTVSNQATSNTTSSATGNTQPVDSSRNQ